MSQNSVTAIVPVSNRTDRLDDVVKMLSEALVALDRPTSILLIVDGDLPTQLAEARRIASDNQRIDLIALARNSGEGGTLRTALAEVDTPIVITHPAYFQVEPEVLKRLVDAVDEGAELAFASRRPGRESAYTRIQRWAFNALMRRSMWVAFRDVSCGVRAGHLETLRELAESDSFHRFLPVHAAVRGFTVREIEADVHPRSPRTRIYSPGTYLRRMLDIINVFFLTRFLHKPLRFFGLIGSGFLAIGVAVCLYLTFVRFALHEPIGQRPALLFGVLMIAVGFQLLALGLLGELITFSRAGRTKPYRVRERLVRSAAKATPAPPPPADSRTRSSPQ